MDTVQAEIDGTADAGVGTVQIPDSRRAILLLVPTHPHDQYPRHAPLGSFKRLAWALEQTSLSLKCECKTTYPHIDWLRDATVDLYIVQLPHHPELYLIPRGCVESVCSFYTSSRFRGSMPSGDSLAMYVVPMAFLVRRIGQMLQEEMEGVNATNDLWTAQNLSLQAMYRIYNQMLGVQEKIDFRHMHPHAHRYAAELDGDEFTIQHRSEGSSVGPYEYRFEDEKAGQSLAVYFRDGTLGGRFDLRGDKGRLRLLRFLRGKLRHARTRNLEAQRHMLTTTPPSPMEAAEVDREEVPQGPENTADKALRFAKMVCDAANREAVDQGLDLLFLFLGHGHTHPFGEAIALRWDWTGEQQRTLRRFGTLPTSLPRLRSSIDRRSCVVLRFSFREYAGRRNPPSEPFPPLAAVAASLPVTNRPFLLVCAPDEGSLSASSRLPRTMMLLPSEFIDFPPSIQGQWLPVNQGQDFGLRMGPSIAQQSGTSVAMKPGLVESRFWLRLPQIIENVDRVLQEDGPSSTEIRHPEVETVRCASFERWTYLTDTDTVVLNMRYYDSSDA
ncbi:hypothetical protein DM02DRAFT_627909 [Periconia macrospinosa]|uniref:Uncharacterized protein n=1 Tax=Periconia macrospinosa TaxID=97972 RepID=A0A2V1DTA1_9PLEO|nr:hypothetical protein DM02DRAFT_627909 [Periconia macrospinosa]